MICETCDCEFNAEDSLGSETCLCQDCFEAESARLFWKQFASATQQAVEERKLAERMSQLTGRDVDCVLIVAKRLRDALNQTPPQFRERDWTVCQVLHFALDDQDCQLAFHP